MNHYYLAEGTKRNNLGDIIQGMSARTFLNENAICLDREKLDEFNGEAGILIANGWFMHDYKAFPPSSKLTPFYISFHLASIKLLLSKENRSHFKKFGPIGCRDRKTQLLFLLNGIPAYYSGCLTVTFNKQSQDYKFSSTDTIVMVDNVDHPFPEEIKDQIKKITNKDLRFFNHDPIHTESHFNDYLKINETYINQLMAAYQGADLVVTNKLHCALPCLSLGIKVIFIHPNPLDARLNIASKFIPIYAYSEVLNWRVIPDFRINKINLNRIRFKLERLTNYFVAHKMNPMKETNNFGDTLQKTALVTLAFALNFLGFFIRKYKSIER